MMKDLLKALNDDDLTQYASIHVEITDKDGKKHLRPVKGVSLLSSDCDCDDCETMADDLMFKVSL